MKLLVVDVGNTSTAVGLWDRGRVSHVMHLDGRERLGNFEGLEKLVRSEKVAGCAYVSVVPKADRAYRSAFRKLGLKVHQVSHEDFGLSPAGRSASPEIAIDYPHPETIGADRLADAAGAVSRYGSPVLVMDFGTALTAAVVTYLVRVLPLTLIRKPIRSRFLRSFLYYVPYVTLAVMTFPAIVQATEQPIAGAAAPVAGIIIAWRGGGLITVAASCCGVAFAAELLLGLR